MLTEKMEKALNEQINAELWSAYLYLSMSNDCASKGLNGAAHWFERQFHEEQEHAMKIKNYILSRGSRVTLTPIAGVETEWDSLKTAFKDTLNHERKVTAMINKLYSLAVTQSDFATQNFLNWFVDEQVEEEEIASNIVDQLLFVDGNSTGIFIIDQKLGER